MNFHIGQKVVCVDARQRNEYCSGCLKEGGIYTIRKVRFNPLGKLGVLLFEVRSGAPPFDDGNERGFLADRFRPLDERKTDISVFTKLLKDARLKEPAALTGGQRD